MRWGCDLEGREILLGWERARVAGRLTALATSGRVLSAQISMPKSVEYSDLFAGGGGLLSWSSSLKERCIGMMIGLLVGGTPAFFARWEM